MVDRQIVRVPPGVFIPEGVEDLKHARPGEVDFSLDDENGEYEVEIIYEEDNSPVDDGPPVPENFTVVKATVRINPDGSQVVDVTFDPDDLAGVDYIQVGATKA